MKHVEEENKIMVLLEPGENVIKSLKKIREKYSIKNGFFYGIGAVDQATLGHYNVEKQDYKEKEFEGQYEVTAFSGNIGPDKVHAHIELGKEDFSTLGGHCSQARVSGTFEIVIFKGDTPLYHELDERTGLDVFDI